MERPIGPEPSSATLDTAPDRTLALSLGTTEPTGRALNPSSPSLSSTAVALALSPEAARSFDTVRSAEGADAAVRRLQDGAFGTPPTDSPLTLAALVEGIRAEHGQPALADPASGDGTPVPVGSVELAQARGGPINWVLQVLGGQDLTLKQEIVNAVITSIPGIDQVADVRDLFFAARDILADPRDTAAWVGAALTGIGFIPAIGSGLKGVARIAYNGDNVVDIFRALDRLGVEDAGGFLRANVQGLASDAVRRVDRGFDQLANALGSISGLHPSIAGAVGEINSIRSMGTDRLEMAADHLEDRIRHVADRVPARVASPESAARAVRGFTTQTYHVGGVNFVLGQNRMSHFLQRHHPQHWTGEVKSNQTFFDRRMSVDNVREAVEATLHQNRDEFLNGAARPGQSLYGTYQGVQYQMKVGGYAQNGMLQIGQFYPVSN